MADKGKLAASSSDDEEIENLFQMQPIPLDSPGPSGSVPPVIATPDRGDKANLLPPGAISSSSPAPTASAGPADVTSPRVYNTLNEPVLETLKRDILRVVTNLRTVVFPFGNTQSSLRDWDLWGPFFFIIFLALILSSAASTNKSKVFAVVFGVLSMGAVVLTLNVLLLGGKIIFFQALSVLGYCLFPLDLGALLCLLVGNKFIRFTAVLLTLVWSSWAAYPFISGAVAESRKALAVYPVFLLYISVGFLVLGND